LIAAAEAVVRLLGIAGFLLCTRIVCATEFPRVTADLATYDAHVAAADAEFARRPADVHERNWVKLKLAHMVNVDQYMRKFSMTPAISGYSDAERQDFATRFTALRWHLIDDRNTADLKELLAIHGWFTISSFGAEADNDAWLLVQHADQDRDFQKRVLAMLEPLVTKGETRPEHYAYLYDRISTPQRYGTQGRCVGKGLWEPREVEDPARLDEYRASVGLMSEADYQRSFKDLCSESETEALRKLTDGAKEGAAAKP
jgi:hypothetical protein